MAMSKIAANGYYPDCCKAMVEIIENKGWEKLKFESFEDWRRKYFPKRKDEAYLIADAGMVQFATVGKSRIGEASYEVACALAEAHKEEFLNEVLAKLGGWDKAIKCLPSRIRDVIHGYYPGLRARRELHQWEKSETERIKRLSAIKNRFKELSLMEQYEFFSEHFDKFIEGEIRKELKGYLRLMEIMTQHLNHFINIVEQGVNEANDPTLYMFRSPLDEDDFSEVEL